MLEKLGIPGILELTSLEAYETFCEQTGMGFYELNMNFPFFSSGKLLSLLHSKKDFSKLYSIHLPDNLDIAEFNTEIRLGNIELIKNLLTAIPKNSLKILNIHLQKGNCFTLPDKVCFFYELYEKEYLETLQSSLSELIPLLKEKNVILAFENTGICHFSFIQKALACIVKTPHCALTWDIGHDAKSHYRDFKYFYCEHQDNIAHLHIHDFDGTLDHKELYTGEVDLNKIFDFLRTHDIRGVIETKNLPTLNASIEKIKCML